MDVRTRGLDIAINAKRQAARAEAKGVVDMLWSPTIRAALIAGTPWLDVFCPGCGTSRAIDLRKVDRHPLASVATLVLGLRCSWRRHRQHWITAGEQPDRRPGDAIPVAQQLQQPRIQPA
jgi:hypothetical protein